MINAVIYLFMSFVKLIEAGVKAFVGRDEDDETPLNL